MARHAGYEDKRRSIIDTALEALIEEGYESVTVDRVIAAAGISKGTFYHYFPSKETLVEAAMLVATDAIADEAIAAASSHTDALQRLDALLTLVRPWASPHGHTNRALAQVLLRTTVLEALRTRAFSMLTERLTPPFADVLGAGARDGSFQAGDTPLIAELIVLLALSTRARAISLTFADRSDPEAAAGWVDAFLTVVERTLGLPPSTLHRDDAATIERSMT